MVQYAWAEGATESGLLLALLLHSNETKIESTLLVDHCTLAPYCGDFFVLGARQVRSSEMLGKCPGLPFSSWLKPFRRAHHLRCQLEFARLS
jgi:hypothetical protein